MRWDLWHRGRPGGSVLIANRTRPVAASPLFQLRFEPYAHLTVLSCKLYSTVSEGAVCNPFFFFFNVSACLGFQPQQSNQEDQWVGKPDGQTNPNLPTRGGAVVYQFLFRWHFTDNNSWNYSHGDEWLSENWLCIRNIEFCLQIEIISLQQMVFSDQSHTIFIIGNKSFHFVYSGIMLPVVWHQEKCSTSCVLWKFH